MHSKVKVDMFGLARIMMVMSKVIYLLKVLDKLSWLTHWLLVLIFSNMFDLKFFSLSLSLQGSQNHYKGISDCVRTIVKEEGSHALFKV